MGLVPSVIESDQRGERAFDIYSRLLKDRIVFVGSAIDDALSNLVTAQLLFLAADDPEKDIQLYINSPGGSLGAALAIYDVMQYIAPPVGTMCTGLAASGGSLLLSPGQKGMRMALPHSQVHMHQPWTQGMQGKASDIEIHAREMLRQREMMIRIYAAHCGREIEEVERDVERDFFMSAEQAKAYGLIDSIVERSPQLKPG